MTVPYAATTHETEGYQRHGRSSCLQGKFRSPGKKSGVGENEAKSQQSNTDNQQP